MTDELRIQALQAALDQANMQIIEQREVMGVALEALECAVDYTGGAAWSPSATKQCIEAADVLREVLGETK